MNSEGVATGSAINTAKNNLQANSILAPVDPHNLGILTHSRFRITYTVCSLARTGVAREHTTAWVNKMAKYSAYVWPAASISLVFSF